METKQKQMSLKSVVEETVKDLEPRFADLSEQIAEVSKSTNAMLATQANQKEDNGINQTRILKATMEVKAEQKDGKHIAGSFNEAVLARLKASYGATDPVFVNTVTERVKDLTATGNGGELIVQEYAEGFLTQLWQNTVLDKLDVRFMPASSGNLTIRKIVEGVSAGYVNELGTINTSTIKFGNISLSLKKLMALVPVSRDLLRYSSTNVDAIVRDQIINELAQVASRAFLYGKGELNEPTGVFESDRIEIAGAKKPTFDLGLDMIAELGKKNQSTDDLAWVMGWDTYVALQKEVTTSVGRSQFNELAQGMWHGKPVIVTNHIKKDGDKEDLLLIKKSDIVAIQGMGVEISQSSEASMSTADGVINAFTNEFVITKAVVSHDFKLSRKFSAVTAKVDLK